MKQRSRAKGASSPASPQAWLALRSTLMLAKETVRAIVYCLYWVAPKQDTAIVYGWPDFEDSALALQEALAKTRLSKIVFFVTGDRGEPPELLGPKTLVVEKNSVRGLFHFLTARYVFFTHRCFMRRFPPNVTSVNVWHGMPMKRTAYMLEGDQGGITSKYVLATSRLWAQVMEATMRPLAGVLVTGLPRNDRMFPTPNLTRARLGMEATPLTRLVLWLPTHRQRYSTVGGRTSDGGKTTSPLGVDGMSAEELNATLREHDALALVKPHPLTQVDDVLELSNLLIVNDGWLRSRRISLYELLGEADVLVTDVSSILVDYLILDRPVIHLFPDLEEYASSRGFSLNPIEDYFVGPVARTPDEVLEFLSQLLLGIDAYADKRRYVRDLFHEHADGNSTSRLLRELRLTR